MPLFSGAFHGAGIHLSNVLEQMPAMPPEEQDRLSEIEAVFSSMVKEEGGVMMICLNRILCFNM